MDGVNPLGLTQPIKLMDFKTAGRAFCQSGGVLRASGAAAREALLSGDGAPVMIGA